MTQATLVLPTVEEAIQSAGIDGLLVSELQELTGKSETTVRRELKTLAEAGKINKRPTTQGIKHAMKRAKPPPPPPPEPPAERPGNDLSPRRIRAGERDAAVEEVLQKAGPEGLSLYEIARRIGADDIDPITKWSQSTYLAIRRRNRAGRVERVIAWRYVEPDE